MITIASLRGCWDWVIDPVPDGWTQRQAGSFYLNAYAQTLWGAY